MREQCKIQVGGKTKFRVCDSIVKDDGSKMMVIMGQVGQVDVVSPNGYRYKSGFWDKVLGDERIQESIRNKDMLGMIEHPTDDNDYISTPYEKASHVVLKAWCENGNPFAQIGILNDSRFDGIKSLIDIGHRVGISTRGLGSMERDDISSYIPVEDYVFITWDIVKQPNFCDLRMDKVTDSLMSNPIFRELCEMTHLRDSADEHYRQSILNSERDRAITALREIERFLIRKL